MSVQTEQLERLYAAVAKLPKPYFDDGKGRRIYCGDNCDLLGLLPRECIDLVVTSPPYDDLRTYGGHSWDFYGVAWQLKRILKPGGIIVWVVSDATKNGSESGSSMRQAIHFQELGLNIHDTMIYARDGCRFPETNRYYPIWEYTFVLSRGRPSTTNLIEDRPNICAGDSLNSCTQRERDGRLSPVSASRVARDRVIKDRGVRFNVWTYSCGNGKSTSDSVAFDHPATFPELLARDHIISWSNEGDIVLDPFNGSGTTTKMARQLGRFAIGFDVEEKYCEIASNRLRQEVLF